MFKPVSTTFKIDNHLIIFLQEMHFFAEISRSLGKVATLDIPTAAVTYQPGRDEFVLYYNPIFFESLSDWQIRNVLLHEFLHLIYGHLTLRNRAPAQIWRYSTDLAINSLIYSKFAAISKPSSVVDPKEDPLPRFALLPGRRPIPKDGDDNKPKSATCIKIENAIASFPPLKASEWYHQQLTALLDPNENENLPFDSLDDHEAWNDGDGVNDSYVADRLKSIIGKAIRFADNKSGGLGWGKIPSDIVSEIRELVSRTIDWRWVLRQFVGYLIKGRKRRSIRKINRRYPYIHSGQTSSYTARLLIAIDQSGSVSDEMVAMFFDELRSLLQNCSIDVVVFDTECGPVSTWDKGTPPKFVRTKIGGTNFNAPTKLFNAPENRGRWDGMLIMTDGGADKPIDARKKRGWILGPKQELVFQTDELQIKMDDSRKPREAIR